MRLVGQNAVEFLFTYSVVITILVLMIALLFVISGGAGAAISPAQCTFYGGLSCATAVYTINAPSGVAAQLVIAATASQPGTINVSSFTATLGTSHSTGGYCTPTSVSQGEAIYCVANFIVAPATGSLYTGNFSIYANYCTGSRSQLHGNCTSNSNFTYTGSVRVQAGNTPVIQPTYSTRIYVTQFGGSTVAVVNATTLAVNSVNVGSEPIGLAFTPNGAYAFVANWNGNTVSVINTTTLAVRTVSVGHAPWTPAVTPSGAYAFVATANGIVAVINTTTLAVRTINVGGNPWGVAITNNGKYAYVANWGEGLVSVINTGTLAVTNVIVGSNPYGVTITPNGAYAYVPDQGSASVSVINTETLAVTNVNVGGAPEGVTISPNGAYAYVWSVSSGNTVYIINTATLGVSSVNVIGPPGEIGFTPSSSAAYVTNSTANLLDPHISVINTSTLSVNVISVGYSSTGQIAFSQNGIYAYAPVTEDTDAGYLAVLNTNTKSVDIVSMGGQTSRAVGILTKCNLGSFTLLNCTTLSGG